MSVSDPLPSRSSIPPSFLPPLTVPTKLAYGAGDLGTAITANLLIFYLSPFLTDVAGLPPALAGRTQLIGKIWDAVNDPLVGVLSDRTQSKWGRRYPWMILGAVPFGVFFFLQWIVPRFSGNIITNQWGLFWYYTLISILFNAFYTVVNLPYTALTPELTQDYNERTSLNSFRFVFSIGGSILSVLIVGAIAHFIPNNLGRQYWVMGVVGALLSVLPLYVCVGGTRARANRVAAHHPELVKPVSVPFWEQLRIVLGNRPFLFVVGIYLCSWLSLQLTATILPYFVRSWMGLHNPLAVVSAILAVQGTAMAFLFVWSWASGTVGKQMVYLLGMGFWVLAQVGLFILQPGQTVLLYVLAIAAGIGVSTAYLIPWSMLPDVIEWDELQTGQRREGVYYSFIVFLQKVCLGVAIALVLQGLGWAGYVKPEGSNLFPEQPVAVLEVIRWSIGPLPMVLLLIGMILAYFYPITREVHAQLLLSLEERRTLSLSSPGSNSPEPNSESD